MLLPKAKSSRNMLKEKELKKYAVKKFVMATSVMDAIKREKTATVDEVWVDQDWMRNQPNKPSVIGFMTEEKE